jgi:hypothetical protein
LFGDKYPNFHIYTDPVILGLGNKNFALVPWINKENQDDILGWIKTVDAPILCGHFELDGYQVMRNVKHTGGQDPKFCDRFDRVWSGHFHQKHEENNVCYFGTEKALIVFSLRFRIVTILTLTQLTTSNTRSLMSKFLFTKRKTLQSLIGCLRESTTKHQRA